MHDIDALIVESGKSLSTVLDEFYERLKPGAYMLVEAMASVSHKTAMKLEDQGMEIRDVISHFFMSCGSIRTHHWILARKPMSEKTVVANVRRWGTGALNIDATRVTFKSAADAKEGRSERGTASKGQFATFKDEGDQFDRSDRSNITGRFPANVIFEHMNDCVFMGEKTVRVQSGANKITTDCGDSIFGKRFVIGKQAHHNADHTETVAHWVCTDECPVRILDLQSRAKADDGASRFFYCVKFHRELLEYFETLISPKQEITVCLA